MAAPTSASLDEVEMLYARPVATAFASASCVAPTRTAPVPCTVSDGATVAKFLMSTQLTAIAAATPTLPPELPDWLDAWPFALLESLLEPTWSFAFGRLKPLLLPFLFVESLA